MISFPNAKINLGLNVVEKRSDGFHNISSCFFPIGWHDILEIIPHKKLSFQSTGIPIPGRENDNLCLKAHKLLQEDFGIDEVAIHLHKIIPIGAGLGGGSADASFTLKSLNTLFQLELTNAELKRYASKIGSDCAFFIDNIPAIASQKGDVLTPINLDLSTYCILLINPNIHIGTAEAYAGINPSASDLHIETIISSHDIHTWKSLLHNDFEKSTFLNYPRLMTIKEELYNSGAVYASMTGSGSTLYGIFDVLPTNLNQWKKYEVWSGKMIQNQII